MIFCNSGYMGKLRLVVYLQIGKGRNKLILFLPFRSGFSCDNSLEIVKYEVALLYFLLLLVEVYIELWVGDFYSVFVEFLFYLFCNIKESVPVVGGAYPDPHFYCDL